MEFNEVKEILLKARETPSRILPIIINSLREKGYEKVEVVHETVPPTLHIEIIHADNLNVMFIHVEVIDTNIHYLYAFKKNLDRILKEIEVVNEIWTPAAIMYHLSWNNSLIAATVTQNFVNEHFVFA